MPGRPSSPSHPAPPARLPALDAARAFGVVAMVGGHTLDAVLSPAARAEPLLALYWHARGFTAPLFLVVAGWALVAATVRRGVVGGAVLRSRLPRVALLLAVGLLLRWPGWAADGIFRLEAEPWRHLLAFDVLQTIAAGLLVSAALLSLPLDRGRVMVAFGLLAAAALTASFCVPDASLPDGLGAIALEQAVGGTSPFPVFPWLVYLFVGAVLGLAVRDGGRRTALLVGGAGCSIPIPQAEKDPTRFYVLSSGAAPPPAAADTTQAKKAPTVHLREVEVASYLASRPIIIRRGEHEIEFREFARWGESLDLGIGRVLREELLARGAAGAVMGRGLRAAGVSYDRELTVRVLTCEGAADGTVLFRAVWELSTGGAAPEPVARGDHRAAGLRWDGASEASLVAQLSQAVSGLAAEIAAALAQ